MSFEAGGFVGGGVLDVHAVGSSQDYYQTFSAVTAVAGVPRAAERLTFEQTIDTSHRAFNAQWTRLINRITFIVGTDYRYTDSHQDELRYVLVGGVNTLQPGSPFPSGGEERIVAGYARATITATDALTVRGRRARRLVALGARGSTAGDEGRDVREPARRSVVPHWTVSIAGVRRTTPIARRA